MKYGRIEYFDEIVECLDQNLPLINCTQLQNRRGTSPIVEQLFGNKENCGYHIALMREEEIKEWEGGESKGVIKGGSEAEKDKIK